MSVNRIMNDKKEDSTVQIVEDLIIKAKEAMRIYSNYSQEEVNEVVQAVAWSILKPGNAEELARLAVADTGLGNYSDKVNKNRRKTMGALRDLLEPSAKSVGIINVDNELGITEIAKPVGVVAAVIPSTNPAATPINKAMFALKGGNSIIFSPSPKGATTCNLLIDYVHRELRKIGAPTDLVQCLPAPINKKLTRELISQSDLVTVTGSANNVQNAQASGKPNLCVGPGNVVSIVDSSANLADAAHKIMLSKTFDYATSCSSDNAVVIESSVYDQMIHYLKKEGGYLCNSNEKLLVQEALWPEGGKLNSKIIAKPPKQIANEAKLTNPDTKNAKFFMVEENGIGKGYLFSKEKLSVVLAVYKAKDFEHAIEITKKILNYQGKGHSCGLHSNNKEHIAKIGFEMDVCRLLINQAQSLGNGGSFNNGLNFTLSMGGGTWAGNNIGENLSYKHFINITKVSKPIPEVIPSEEELLGDYIKKYGG